jgi:hypothetical protein
LDWSRKGFCHRPIACEVRLTDLLAEYFSLICRARLEPARHRQACLSCSTCFNRRVIAAELISIFIRYAPEILNIVLVLAAPA